MAAGVWRGVSRKVVDALRTEHDVAIVVEHSWYTQLGREGTVGNAGKYVYNSKLDSDKLTLNFLFCPKVSK